MSCPHITRELLQGLIKSGKGYVLIDVREPWEVEKYGAIPTSKNVPLSEFQRALELTAQEFKSRYHFTWNKDDNTIFYCRSGHRSERACAYARVLGYNSANFTGSVLEWSEIDPRVKAY